MDLISLGCVAINIEKRLIAEICQRRQKLGRKVTRIDDGEISRFLDHGPAMFSVVELSLPAPPLQFTFSFAYFQDLETKFFYHLPFHARYILPHALRSKSYMPVHRRILFITVPLCSVWAPMRTRICWVTILQIRLLKIFILLSRLGSFSSPSMLLLYLVFVFAWSSSLFLYLSTFFRFLLCLQWCLLVGSMIMSRVRGLIIQAYVLHPCVRTAETGIPTYPQSNSLAPRSLSTYSIGITLAHGKISPARH